MHEPGEEGESLLSLACSAGYYELAEVLLRMRAGVEDRGLKGDISHAIYNHYTQYNWKGVQLCGYIWCICNYGLLLRHLLNQCHYNVLQCGVSIISIVLMSRRHTKTYIP